MAGCDRVRRDRPRRDAARARRLRDLPRAARARRLDAGAAPHRARRRRGPRRGPRRRRGRLPREAVLVRRAARAAARARPRRVPASGRRCSRSTTCGSTRPRTARGAATPSSSSRRRSSRCSSSSCAAPARRSRASSSSTARWDMAFESRSNVVDVYVRYLREKIDRPFGRHSLETVRGVGYRLRTDARVSRLPIRVRLTLPFALAMALVLAAIGRVRLRPRRRRAADERRPDAAAPGGRGGRPRSAREGRCSTATRPTGRGSRRCSARTARVVSSSPATLRRAARRRRVRRALAGHAVEATRDDLHRARRTTGGCSRCRPASGRRASVLVLGRPLARAARRRSTGCAREFLVAAPAALAPRDRSPATCSPPRRCGPVEAMRRRAAAITASTPGSRLPVPPSRDEVSRLAETLNDMLGRLEAAFEHERRFLADASHELRTPLALLRTELELALRRPRSRDELEEALRSAADETERLTRLAEDLLLIARSDRGSLPIRRERVSARELLDDVAEPLRRRAPRRRDASSRSRPATTPSSTPTRSGSARRSGTSSTTRSRTARPRPALRRRAPGAGRAARDRRGPGLPAGVRRRARSTASAAPTTPAARAAPGSGSRSSS